MEDRETERKRNRLKEEKEMKESRITERKEIRKRAKQNKKYKKI